MKESTNPKTSNAATIASSHKNIFFRNFFIVGVDKMMCDIPDYALEDMKIGSKEPFCFQFTHIADHQQVSLAG